MGQVYIVVIEIDGYLGVWWYVIWVFGVVYWLDVFFLYLGDEG